MNRAGSVSWACVSVSDNKKSTLRLHDNRASPVSRDLGMYRVCRVSLAHLASESAVGNTEFKTKLTPVSRGSSHQPSTGLARLM